jgi:ABC-type nitrate/sulfonate/bicarbonate transport system permease component
MTSEILQALVEALDKILIGIAIGIVIGTLMAINRILIRIWSVLMDIERNTRK